MKQRITSSACSSVGSDASFVDFGPKVAMYKDSLGMSPCDSLGMSPCTDRNQFHPLLRAF
jgi:hypothetical protein